MKTNERLYRSLVIDYLQERFFFFFFFFFLTFYFSDLVNLTRIQHEINELRLRSLTRLIK
jgi:hypothetical protein